MKAKIVGVVVHDETGRIVADTRAAKPQGTFPLATKVKTRNISLPSELDIQIEQRVRSGRYGNASDVVRAGLRALLREEMAGSYRQFQDIMAALPRDPITPEIEQDIERQVKAGRAADKEAVARKVRHVAHVVTRRAPAAGARAALQQTNR